MLRYEIINLIVKFKLSLSLGYRKYLLKFIVNIPHYSVSRSLSIADVSIFAPYVNPDLSIAMTVAQGIRETFSHIMAFASRKGSRC